jgi:hypothetical protein
VKGFNSGVKELTTTAIHTVWRRIIEYFKNIELGADVEGSGRGLIFGIVRKFVWRELTQPRQAAEYYNRSTARHNITVCQHSKH